jgi:hypothetical protein
VLLDGVDAVLDVSVGLEVIAGEDVAEVPRKLGEAGAGPWVELSRSCFAKLNGVAYCIAPRLETLSGWCLFFFLYVYVAAAAAAQGNFVVGVKGTKSYI